MGTCNGVLSSCALAGYAMETRFVLYVTYPCSLVKLVLVLARCRLGKSIFYDTVSNFSWAVDVRTHGIVTVIDRVLSDPWPPSVEVGREVPEAKADVDCVVSFLLCGGVWPKL